LRRALEAHNSYQEDGRITATLLHLQHACEMLLKACLVQKQVPVFDKKTGTSIGIKKCVRLAMDARTCNLGAAEAGTIRAIDCLRDSEQHWLLVIEERLLYLHARALVTALD